jgi:hypothetical protein
MTAAVTAPPPGAARRRRPPFRRGLVSRSRLVARLADARDVPLALVVAPAGYGKTTALAEWAEKDGRPFAWIALKDEDNDPAHLLASIALALDDIEPGVADVPPGGLGPAIAGRQLPFVLVLDDAHALTARSSGRSSITCRMDRSWRSPRVPSWRCRSDACAPTAVSSSSGPATS